MSTHTLEVAEVMCDRIAIVYRGKMAAQGTHGRAAGADRVRQRARWRTCSSSSPAASGSISSIRSSRAEVERDGRDPAGALDPAHPEAARRRSPGSGSSGAEAGPRCCCSRSVGGVFWTGIFGIAYRVLSYIQRVDDIGDLLAGKMLSVILLAFLSILLLSNVITALSTFFLAKDLDLLVAAPVGGVAALPGQAGRDGGALVLDGGAARAAHPVPPTGSCTTAGRSFRWSRRGGLRSLPGAAGGGRGDRHHAPGERLSRAAHPGAARSGRTRRGWASC